MWQNARCIVCVDMNAFFAAVEQREQASLRNLPVAVTNGERGSCVITCSYEARAFGIMTGMRLAEAFSRCEKLQVCRSRPYLYAKVSTQLMQLLTNFSPDIEVFSIDEAFLDMSKVRHGYDSAIDLARAIQQSIYHELSLPASVGIGADKTIAKYAAKYKKPFGITVIPPDRAATVLGPLAVDDLCGVGPGIKKFLARYGAHTCADVAKMPGAILANRFGNFGRRVWLMCQGSDPDPVRKHNALAKSMGHSKILPPGCHQLSVLRRYLCALAFKLSERMQVHQVWSRQLQLALHYQHRDSKVVVYSFQEPMHDYATFSQVVDQGLTQLWHADKIVRKVHVHANTLVRARQRDLFTKPPETESSQPLQALMRKINRTFGANTIQFACIKVSTHSEVIAPSWRPEGSRNHLQTTVDVE